ncbi:MAG: transglutaminase-like domain-containing protein [Prevotellaceae bacterium]|jgi:regulator of sirC expression with transglutaminase-like and TPR domain|nr:transglutaminase-like domain-containing protein [Prevotellaceae bacterium]
MLHALLILLDDPDTVVFDAVAERFLEEGRKTIPLLEKVLAENHDEHVRERIQTLIRQIRAKEVQDGLQQWLDGTYHDLLEGAYWIARQHYPALQWNMLQRDLDNILKDIIVCTSDDSLPMLNKLTIFNQLFYQTHGFKRTSETLNPLYCFINRLVETQHGNAVSLGTLYLYLAQQNGWPLYGVCLPDIFLIAYTGEAGEVLCYINPFNNGLWAGKSSVTAYLEQRGIEPRPEYYRPCDNVTVILRLLEYTIYTFEQEGKTAQAAKFRELLPLFGSRTTHFLEGL